jgi:membrane dipeptidase
MPVAFTHSNPNALCPAGARNKPDDLIQAVAETGGIIGATFFPALVKRQPGSHVVVPSTVEDVVDHIDYLVKLVGVEHVGFGSDMPNYHARTLEAPATSSIRHYRPLRPDVYGDGPTDRYDPYPADLDAHTKLRNLTAALVRRGYSDDDVLAIMGGNWIRVARQVWRG